MDWALVPPSIYMFSGPIICVINDKSSDILIDFMIVNFGISIDTILIVYGATLLYNITYAI